MNTEIRKYYGRHACRAILSRRLDAVEKVYLDRAQRDDWEKTIQILERKNIECKLVGETDLYKLTKSEHHQGICVAAAEREDILWEAIMPAKDVPVMFLLLDGVENPHNLGAMLRTAAHFGVRAVVGDMRMPRLSPAAVRTAEGAAEYIPLVRVESLAQAIISLRDNDISVVGADSGKRAKNLYTYKTNLRSAFVMGSEVRGLSHDVLAVLPQTISIPGTGWVESLNVNSAAAVVLSEWAKVRFLNSP